MTFWRSSMTPADAVETPITARAIPAQSAFFIVRFPLLKDGLLKPVPATKTSRRGPKAQDLLFLYAGWGYYPPGMAAPFTVRPGGRPRIHHRPRKTGIF